MTDPTDTIDATSHFLRACERGDVEQVCTLLERGHLPIDQVGTQGALMATRAPCPRSFHKQCLVLLLPFCDPCVHDCELLRTTARLQWWDVCHTLFQKTPTWQKMDAFRAIEPLLVASDKAEMFANMWSSLPNTTNKDSKGFSIFTDCLRHKAYYIASYLCSTNTYEDMHRRYTLSYSARTAQSAQRAESELEEFTAWKQKQRLLAEIGEGRRPKPKRM